MGVKQVIVMRNDLNMRKGKMIAQGAHAAMKVFFDRGDLGYYWRSGASGSLFEGEDDPGNPGAFAMLITLTRAMWAWANGSFTKVVVRADSEEQLLDLYRQAREAHLPVALAWLGTEDSAGKILADAGVTTTAVDLVADFKAAVRDTLAAGGVDIDAAEPSADWDDSRGRGSGCPDQDSIERARGDRNRALLVE